MEGSVYTSRAHSFSTNSTMPTARMALNYKKIPYRTEWIEYPDLAPTFQKLDIPPNDSKLNPNSQYSIPAAKLPDGRYIMDSLAIAQELENFQPKPSLHLDDPAVQRMQASVLKIMATLGPDIYVRIPAMLLNDRSAEYFEQTRAKRFGMPLDQLRAEKGGEQAWQAAQEAFDEIKGLLTENPDGPFVRGQEVSFADFIFAGLCRMVERLDDGDLFGRLLAVDGRFGEHYKACREFIQKDD